MMLRVLPICLFFAFLLLPIVARYTGVPAPAPLQEYRTLASFPVASEFFNAEKTDFLAYTEQLNAWYSDQFATRPFWVRLQTQIRYSLFGESDQVYVGKDNWLFYHSVIDVELPQLEQNNAVFQQQMIDRFARLAELLEQRGITLFMMPLGYKTRYYPEFLPAAAAHAVKFRFYDNFMDTFIADGRVRVNDTRKLLEDAKASGLKIFHQTDFHWTDAAGALAIKPVLEQIATMEGMPELLAEWDYDIIDDPNISGGQARALPLFRTPTENSIRVEPHSPVSVVEEQFNTNGSEWVGVARPGQPRRFSPVFVYGDSFFDSPNRAGFLNFFSAFAYARLYSNDLTEAYRQRPPGTRYMVIEYIPSGTYGIDDYVTALLAALEKDPAL